MQPTGTSTRTLGGYELLQLIGRGGMAEVWLAVRRGHGGFEHKVAIKRILDEFTSDRSFVRMFVAEARLCARLSHPNIVAVHELGQSDGTHYIVMEYVDGRDLRSLLGVHRENDATLPMMAAYVVRGLARALGYAHGVTDDRGKPLRIIHRDVTPANLVVGFDGSIKLVDFGIAKALAELGSEHTRSGMLKGKIGYLAPEQLGASARQIDHRVDLWAAGVVLWETLTGRRLFRGVNEAHTLDLVRTAAIVPPSSQNSHVSPELDRIVHKALSRAPDERYQSGNDFADDLEHIVAQERFGATELGAIMHNTFGGGPPTHLIASAEGEDTRKEPSVVFASSAPRSRTRRSWPIVAAALVLGGAAAGAIRYRTRGSASSPAPVVAPRAIVHVLVDSVPPGAAIFVGDEPNARGVTPIDLELPRGSAPVTLRGDRAGFLSAHAEVVLDHDATLRLALGAAATADLGDASE